jgi:hypothetical protein
VLEFVTTGQSGATLEARNPGQEPAKMKILNKLNMAMSSVARRLCFGNTAHSETDSGQETKCITYVATRNWIFLLLFYSLGAPTIAAQGDVVPLNPAATGRLYTYTIETTQPAIFNKVSGNADWLTVTRDGVLRGTPDKNAPAKSEITVEAFWQGPPLRRTFVIPVYAQCLGGRDEVFAWCDGERPGEDGVRPNHNDGIAFRLTEKPNDKRGDMDCPKDKDKDKDSDGCIVQFSRLRGFRGDFGHFEDNQVAWSLKNYDGDGPAIDAINGSKISLSGSILILDRVDNCKFLSWMVLTQSVDSSNILFYGPSEVSAFCTKSKMALIVLPVHAIWADVYGTPANVNDPAWKPTPEPPMGHECYTGGRPQGSYPSQGIRPCDKAFPREDTTRTIPCALNQTPCNSNVSIPPSEGNEDEKPHLATSLFYRRWIAWHYNRLTQPGVSQGSISIAPIALAIKNTWDVQTYESTRVGPGSP